MPHTMQEQVIAFAGLCQAAHLVQQFARDGQCDNNVFIVSLKSLLQTDPPTTESVYGSIASLRVGLQTMRQQLGNQNEQRDPEITRYLIGLIALSRRLLKRNDMQSMLGERLSQVKRQLTHFEITDEQVQANLASIYSDIISPLGSRIQVTGEARLLQQTSVQNKVRATLLCGIRAGVLWQQVGGKRLQLIFARNKLLSHVETCLSQL
ncbi:high frequency lysogenization protein HflD [Celerinatantimonas sp. YJH-8]|uniref:high frequency lysogenization protein HflD n=1 Tax=Celerinatantimonas sp. YJH-8 TaxID=3228714 RepID=UPI0038C70252